jgi:hypothetical protein
VDEQEATEVTVVGRCGVVWSVPAECKSPRGRMTCAVAPLASGCAAQPRNINAGTGTQHDHDPQTVRELWAYQ